MILTVYRPTMSAQYFEIVAAIFGLVVFRAGVNFHPAHRKPFERFAVERNNSRSMSNNLVNVIFEDSGGGIWIGTDGGGLNRFDPFSKTFTVLSP